MTHRLTLAATRIAVPLVGFAVWISTLFSPLAAQTTGPLRLSIGDVLGIADSASENVGIAKAGLDAAAGRVTQARSSWLPQLTGSASYTRTLKSQFSSFGGGGGEKTTDSIPAPVDCRRYLPRPGLSVGERLDSLERGLDCTANGSSGGLDFSNLPFGQANAWRFGLDLRQSILDFGLSARSRGAHAGERQAEAAFDAARARSLFDAASAYYEALLADRLLSIADSTLAQANRTLTNTQKASQVGTAAEFDLLRATVARDNQLPVVSQRRVQRDVAMLRLKQLLDLDPERQVELVTPLTDTAAVPLPAFALSADSALLNPNDRAPVRQAQAATDAATAARDAAAAARLPTLALTSSYAQLAYPKDFFRFGTFLSDWTVGLQLSVPLFTGGRITGAVREAEANAVAAHLQLKQTRETALRESHEVRELLEAAVESYAASEGTARQAQRAYEIAELRVREGLSTLTDLAEVRLQLQQAEANQAAAARDLHVARLRLRLLRDLPLGTGSAPGGSL